MPEPVSHISLSQFAIRERQGHSNGVLRSESDADIIQS